MMFTLAEKMGKERKKLHSSGLKLKRSVYLNRKIIFNLHKYKKKTVIEFKRLRKL